MKICPRCCERFRDDAVFCPHDGAKLEKPTDRFLGKTIAARYRLIRRLGSGGMSVVYLARHELIDRLSALKILRPELSFVTEHRERFLREARAVNRINHPNIVEITDVGESDGLAYLVMEFVEGESMLTAIQRGPLPWVRAARIGMHVASALARAHQFGVIHRDLKPENILLLKRSDDADGDSEDIVKLTDFGIAKLAGEPTLTVNQQLFGTPGYIAPEYVGGIGIDGRSDIYSLAVVVYEMVTGVLPYDGKGQSELLLKPLTTDPVPPSRRVTGLPPELEALLMRCLARDPAARPHDAFAVHDALGEIVRQHAAERSYRPRSSVEVSGAHVREARETIFDRTSATPGEAPAEGPLVTREIRAQWVAALADLRTRVARKKAMGGEQAREAARAAELALVAEAMVPRIERAAGMVGQLQGTVDALESRGREFRKNLGNAIDVLVHDRSRERAHLDALRARRHALERAASGGYAALAASSQEGSLKATFPLPPSDPASAPPEWEIEALVAEEQRASRVDADLAFQIEMLQKQLDAKNEGLERELVDATGQLEGFVSAVRRLTTEMTRTIQDGLRIVHGSARSA